MRKGPATCPAPLFQGLPERAAQTDLTVIDTDIEATIRIVADPGLECDGSPIAAIVRKWKQGALVALLATREINPLHRQLRRPSAVEAFTSPRIVTR